MIKLSLYNSSLLTRSILMDPNGIIIKQGLKIALVRSYLRVPQAAGQVKMLIFLVKIRFIPIYANIFCDVGQVPI